MIEGFRFRVYKQLEFSDSMLAGASRKSHIREIHRKK